MTIRTADLAAEHAAYRREIDAAVARVLDRGIFILGEEVSNFEKQFASYLGGAKHVIAVANGTEALALSLLAAGVKAGDEVIAPALTAVPTIAAIEMAGATPVLADVDDHFCLDADSLEHAISVRTKAVIPVHLYGQPCRMDEIKEIASRHGLAIVEDACQAHGAEYKGRKAGTLGDAGCFSFYPTKNLGAYGDGGAVCTNSDELAEKLLLLRNYGQRKRYEHVAKGWNSRLDELQAAILSAKLKHLEEWNETRRLLAGIYFEKLRGVQLPKIYGQVKHVFHQFVVRSPSRDGLRAFLEENGVLTDVHYPKAVHEQPAYAKLAPRGRSLANSERAAAEIVSLPVHHLLGKEDAEKVCGLVVEFK